MNDNGYLKAQREYDNQLPDNWEEDLEREQRRITKQEYLADQWEDDEDERRINAIVARNGRIKDAKE